MICSGAIFLQDVKDRWVYWFLFPLLGIFLGTIFFQTATTMFFAVSAMMNFAITTIILLILYAYARWVMKKKFVDHSFGSGDLLFFYALAIGFPTVTFILLFTGGVFFSALLYMLFKKRWNMKTVPLAGFMAFFLLMVLTGSFFDISPSLYIL